MRIGVSSSRIKFLLLAIAAVAVLAGSVEILIHRYDPTRIIYKRLKAENRYVYDEIDPSFLKLDPHSLLSVRTPTQIAALRGRIIDVVWGPTGFPEKHLSTQIDAKFSDPVLDSLPNVGSVERLAVDIGHQRGTASTSVVRSYLYHLTPASAARNELVIYHHGYAGEIRDVPKVLGRFLAEGYAVLGINQPGYGENMGTVTLADGSDANLHYELGRIDHPLRYHIEPTIAGINYAHQTVRYDAIYMVGFSAGAFAATIAAAIDERILKSYPVAGVYPVYLRVGQEVHDTLPAQYPPLLAAGSYLDFFTSGAAGKGRSQLQIFNRYDRCCYNNRKGKLYESVVAGTVANLGLGGRFAVAIDETHADHRISEFALDLILTDMARTEPR